VNTWLFHTFTRHVGAWNQRFMSANSRWVVTHSLADFDFHDHRPAVLQRIVTSFTNGACRGHLCPPCFDHHSNQQQSAPRAERLMSISHSAYDRGASPAPIGFPPSNFKHSLTLFWKSFSSFPRGTCSILVSHLYLSFDEVYHPIWTAFPNNPTRW
jgi:hypothetical protein